MKRRTLTQLKCLNLEKPLIVTDNGYYSQKNMMEFVLGNVKFLTLVDPKIVWVRETVDELSATIDGMSSTCPFDPSICGATSLRMHQFSRIRQRSRNGKVAGEKETISRRLYVHVYYSPDNEAKKEPKKNKSLIKLEKKLKTWLAQRSLAQILDWFDCIETTKVQTVMGSYRWSTESVARDKLFLEYSGVDIK